MSGNFTGTVEAQGDFTNPDSINGTMEIACVDGSYLSPFSSRFMDMSEGTTADTPISPSDMSEFSDLTIRATIGDSNIRVGQFHFVSSDLQVEATGDVGFNKSIDARGGLSVPLDRAKQHPKFGRFVSFLPDTLNRVSLEFTLTGFIYNINFSASPSENLLRGLADQGSDMLHGAGDSFTPIN
jgi:hypothetical protein